MRLLFTLLFFILISPPAAANEKISIYGTWGTKEQCAGTPIKSGGTVLAKPFVINDQWMQHGRLWCKLNWFPVEKREKGIFTGARAQCGEDSIRSYSIGFDLRGEELTIRWDFPYKNGPLFKCPDT